MSRQHLNRLALIGGAFVTTVTILGAFANGRFDPELAIGMVALWGVYAMTRTPRPAKPPPPADNRPDSP
jgi:hypothetical protein